MPVEKLNFIHSLWKTWPVFPQVFHRGSAVQSIDFIEVQIFFHIFHRTYYYYYLLNLKIGFLV